MRQNYERLAWMVLLISFALCVTLAVGVPLAVQSYVRHSYTGQFFALDVQEGNLLVTCPNTDVPIAVVKRQDDLCQGRENIRIAAGGSDRGLLHIRSRSAVTITLSSVQIARDTQLWLKQATTPRFPRLSIEPDKVLLHLDRGSIRVTVPPSLARAMRFEVFTPQAHVQLAEGSVSVEVTSQGTQVISREGEVSVKSVSDGSTAQLRPAQRVVVPRGSSVTEVMPAERNLLVGHSDFREPLDTVWEPYRVPPQIADEPWGDATALVAEGRQVVDFLREGKGHAETGIFQDINRDIRDLRSLQLRMVLRVIQQDVPVCGTLGTECPVMVRIDYVDETGTLRSWQQGFYSLPDTNVPANPTFCVTCNPRNEHILVASGQWHPFESDNLIPVLNKVGPVPVLLKSISIYASGHNYHSQVAEVELLGQE